MNISELHVYSVGINIRAMYKATINQKSEQYFLYFELSSAVSSATDSLVHME